MAVQIALAAREQAASLSACILAAYQTYEVEGISLPPVTEGLAEDIAHGRVWAAHENDILLGCLIVLRDGTSIKIQNLAIHPDHQGRGLSRRLIEKTIEIAQDADCEMITLVTHADIPGNITLYEHFGFSVSDRKGVKIHMVRSLT